MQSKNAGFRADRIAKDNSRTYTRNIDQRLLLDSK